MLPPTPILRGAGAIGGAGLGEALGSVLGAPGDAARNLAIGPFAHSAIAAANGQDDDWSWASMLPGLAGLAAGGAAAFLPGLLPFAPAIGAGVAGLGQAAASALDPRTFRAHPVSELVKALGMDPDSAGGQAAGLGIGALTDPLTYAGGLGGEAAGGAVGGARDELAARAAEMGGLSERTAALQELSRQAEEAVQDFERPANPIAAQLERDLAGPTPNYRQDVLDSLPSLDDLRNMQGAAKVYKQVDPGLARDLDLMGLGVPGEGGVNLPLGKAPPWAESRGGWLKPTRARSAMLEGVEAGDVLPHPSLLGPQLDRAAGPEAVLENPVRDFLAMREGTPGLEGGLRQPSRAAPRLAEALGDAGDALYDNPHAMIDDFPVQPALARDPVTYVKGNVGSLPLYDARDKVNSLLADAIQRHGDLAATEPTRLQAMLQKLGLAPR